MGKFKDSISRIVEEGYARGLDGQHMAMRLIEYGVGCTNAELMFKSNTEWKSHGATPAFTVRFCEQGEAVIDLQPPTAVTDVPPCRSEVVALIDMVIRGCQKSGQLDVVPILENLKDQIALHLEERPIDTEEALRQFYTKVHEANVKAGWWTDLATGEPKKRNVGEMFILMVTELVEAFSAYLVGAKDDKLPQHPGIGVELGDVMIRLADFCGALMAGKIVDNSNANNPGDRMFWEIAKIATQYESIRKTPEANGEPETGDFLPPMDVAKMITDKLEFNAKRPDHKVENRMKPGGKQT